MMTTLIRRIRWFVILLCVFEVVSESALGENVLTLHLRIARNWVYLPFEGRYDWWGYNGQDYAGVTLQVVCWAQLPPGHYDIYGERPKRHSPRPIIAGFDWDGTKVTSAPTYRFYYGFDSADLRATGLVDHPEVHVSGGYRIISHTCAIPASKFDHQSYGRVATIYVGGIAGDLNATGGSSSTSGGGGGLGNGSDTEEGCDCNGCFIYDGSSTNTDLGPAVDYTVPVDSNDVEMYGMARYNFNSMLASLHIADTPIYYKPAFGPPIGFTVIYTQREANDPSWFDYSNLGLNWTFSWLAFVTLGSDPNADSTAEASVRPPSGGLKIYDDFDTTTQEFPMDPATQSVLRRVDDTHYEELFKDGSKYVFAQADQNPVAYPLRLFLTQVVDRHGNAVTLGYDAQDRLRLTTITDAVGNPPTTISYYDSSWLIKQVTDPFGRTAKFQYNSNGQLASITDPAGITSQFTYADVNANPDADINFIARMTTPYGDTVFETNGSNGPSAWIQATDPNGGVERVETVDGAPGIASSEPASLVPTGFSNANQNLAIGNTYYWNKRAMQEAVGPGGVIDYTKAHVTHWLISQSADELSSIPASQKSPLENRVWYQYPDQPDPEHAGTISKPSKIARVLDSGSTQMTQYAYNSLGNATQTVDPLGRTTSFIYDPTNNIDLLEIHQTTGGMDDLLAKYVYYPNHLVHTAQDASRQTSGFSYTSQGMLLTSTNAKLEVTTLVYGTDPTSPTHDYQRLKQVVAPNNIVTVTYGYDSQQRLHTVTDADGYTLTYDYDAVGGNPVNTISRVSKITYPDGTYEQTLYNLFDPEWTRDRLGRWSHKTYDPLEHLVSVTDPAGRTTQFTWCTCGALESIVDGNNNTTTFIRDIESRVTDKKFADLSTIHYAYEGASGRLHIVTDALNQVTTYSYLLDGNLQQVQYTNAIHATPGVSFTYDPNYNRLATMSDATGTTVYNYNPILVPPSLGAGKLHGINIPVASGSATIQYAYDEVGRVVNSSIDERMQSVEYDSLGRVTSGSNGLGNFTNTYVNNIANRLDHVDYPNGMKVAFQYFDNTGDKRLKQIKNLDPSGNLLSQFDYTYNAIGQIQSWTQNNNGMSNPQQYAFGYDSSGSLTDGLLKSLDGSPAGTLTKTLHYAYDNAGNRLSEQAGGMLTSSTFGTLNQLSGQNGGNTLHVAGTISKPAAVNVNGVFASVDGNLNFGVDVPVTGGSNTITVQATTGRGQTQTNRYGVSVTQGASRTLGYDANGNMIDNGSGQTYEWDPLNRLIAINESATQRTEFVYNGQGQRVQIVEKTSGTVTGTKNFVWMLGSPQPSEERDGNNIVIKRFYGQGEKIGETSYFYTKDHLGSIREMTDNAGAIHARYDYDPYGRPSKPIGDIESDFGYAGYYSHQLSGLYLTLNRGYSPNLGRWISRDPSGENGGINLYGYVLNDPINAYDPLGLAPPFTVSIYSGVANPGPGYAPGSRLAQAAAWTSGQNFALDFTSPQFASQMQAIVNQYGPIDRIFIFDHGTADQGQGFGYSFLTPDELQQLAKYVNPSGDFVFAGCNVAANGTKGPDYLQNMANAANRPITAWDGLGKFLNSSSLNPTWKFNGGGWLMWGNQSYVPPSK